jgi:uncharacterized protein YrzB (UPF0473 family)
VQEEALMAKEKREDEIFTEDQDTVTLSLDNGQEIECLVLGIFEACGREYVALLPSEEQESEEGTVFLYRYLEDENGEAGVGNIESDAEYKAASNRFNELINSYGYEDVVDEDELDS